MLQKLNVVDDSLLLKEKGGYFDNKL